MQASAKSFYIHDVNRLTSLTPVEPHYNSSLETDIFYDIGRLLSLPPHLICIMQCETNSVVSVIPHGQSGRPHLHKVQSLHLVSLSAPFSCDSMITSTFGRRLQRPIPNIPSDAGFSINSKKPHHIPKFLEAPLLHSAHPARECLKFVNCIVIVFFFFAKQIIK